MDETAPYVSHAQEFYKSKGVKFNGLHAAMQRGKTRTVLQKFSSQEYVKNILKDSKIGCEILNEKCALCNDNELINSLIVAKGRETYREKQAQHDIALINWCKKSRPRNLSNVKSAKSWVLTNDIKLTYWNKNNTDSDIQECITETQLCHLLWIDEPKDEGIGMISTILALANRNSVNFAELEAFLVRAETHRKNLESSEEIDMFTLAFHSDAITTIDIKNAYSSDDEFSSMIQSKARAIKEESQRKDAVIEEQKAQKNAAEKLLKLKSLECDKLELEKSNINLNMQSDKISNDITRKESQKESWLKADKSANRLSAIIILLCCLLLFFLGYKFYDVCEAKIANSITNTVFSFVIPLIFGFLAVLFSYMLSLVIIIAFGKPFSWNNTFAILQNEILHRKLKKYNIKENFSIDNTNEEIQCLYSKLTEIKQQLTSNNDKINTIDYNIAVLKSLL